MKARRFITSSLVATALVVGAPGVQPAGAAPEVKAPEIRGARIDVSGWFTSVKRNKGWVQAYGVVRVKNLSRHRVHATCTVFVKTGTVVIGSDTVDLVVRRRHSARKGWGVEGGDEGGKVTGFIKCHT